MGAMDIKVDPEMLDQAIKDALNDWSSDVRRQINFAVRDTAKDIAKMLRGGGPYHDRPITGGRYTKGWDAKLDTRSYRASLFHTETWTVYNKTDYQLTHLLEFGHAVKRGGRKIGDTPAYPHIADKEDIAGQVLISRISRNVAGMI